jgi:DNA recombination protein RmuC
MLAEKVVLAGPTTLAALLNSLQMGFRTLTIQKRSAEVWDILGAVKAEFLKFGSTISQVERKLREASNKISEVHTRSNVLQRKLRDIDTLSESDSAAVLRLEPIIIAAQADEPERDGNQEVNAASPSA